MLSMLAFGFKIIKTKALLLQAVTIIRRYKTSHEKQLLPVLKGIISANFFSS